MENVIYKGPEDGDGAYPGIHLTCADGGRPDEASEIVIHVHPGRTFFEFYFGPGFLGTRQYLMTLAPGQEDRLRTFSAKWLLPKARPAPAEASEAEPKAPANPTGKPGADPIREALARLLHQEATGEYDYNWERNREYYLGFAGKILSLLGAQAPGGARSAEPEQSPNIGTTTPAPWTKRPEAKGCAPCPDCGEPLTPHCYNLACKRNQPQTATGAPKPGAV